jgi:hypothetical protein
MFLRKQDREAVKLLSDRPPPYVGIAIKQTTKSKLDAIALATCTQGLVDQAVAIIDSRSRQKSPPSETLFCELLDGTSGTTLVGFDMPEISLFVFRDLGLKAAGIDLVPLYSDNSLSPTALVRKVIFCSGSKFIDL